MLRMRRNRDLRPISGSGGPPTTRAWRGSRYPLLGAPHSRSPVAAVGHRNRHSSSLHVWHSAQRSNAVYQVTPTASRSSTGAGKGRCGCTPWT